MFVFTKQISSSIINFVIFTCLTRTIFMSMQLMTYINSLLLNAAQRFSNMLTRLIYSTPLEMALA